MPRNKRSNAKAAKSSRKKTTRKRRKTETQDIKIKTRVSRTRKSNELASQADIDWFSQKENNLLLNSTLANAVISRALVDGLNRDEGLKELHKHLFDPATIQQFENGERISLYATALNDHHRGLAAIMKYIDTSEKSRFLREFTKTAQEFEKRKAAELGKGAETDKLVNLMHALVTESMRLAIEDEVQQKYGGSNTHKPIEDTNYEIVSLDPNSDDD